MGDVAYLPGMPTPLHDSLKRSLELPLTWISLRQSRTNSSVDLRGLGHCLEQSRERQHALSVQPHLKLDLTWNFISDVSSGNKTLTYKVLFPCKAWQLDSVRATDTRQRIQDVLGKLGGPFMLILPPKFKTSSRSTGDDFVCTFCSYGLCFPCFLMVTRREWSQTLDKRREPRFTDFKILFYFLRL